MIKYFAGFALAIGFILPIADRLGLLGPPGHQGVAWGDWSHFLNYTHQLIPFVSRSMANIFAITATLIEGILALGLLAGYQLKWMGLGTAVITAIFGIFMFFSLGFLAPFTYPVFVFTACGLLLWR